MNYLIDETTMPERLRAQGTRAWIGDTVLGEDELEKDGLHVICAFMERDIWGEITILFALPAGKLVSASLIRQCRRCALNWLSEWTTTGEKWSRSLLNGTKGSWSLHPTEMVSCPSAVTVGQ